MVTDWELIKFGPDMRKYVKNLGQYGIIVQRTDSDKWSAFFHPRYLWVTWLLSNIVWVVYHTQFDPHSR